MVTIRDVAKLAEVSTSTVSHVVNETRFVKPETCEKVLRAMTELNYRPNRVARSLRNRQTNTFGVLFPNSANPYFTEVLLGIEESCFDHSYNIILGNANDDPKRELSYLNVLLSRQVDGILLISTGAYKESLSLLDSYDTPVVLVDRASQSTDVDEIITANKDGGLLATKHLLSLGHTRIGCITGPSTLTPSADRVAGYYEALTGAGITIGDNLVRIGDFQHQSGYEICQQLLQLKQPPTAIFACNDLMAVGVLSAIHDAGLRVPHDISVIGYDNIPLASYTIPHLTTVAQPSRQLGRVAVEQLINRLKQPHMPPQRDVLSVSLIERNSCSTFTGGNL
jgi:LacI family transcriptional regulator